MICTCLFLTVQWVDLPCLIVAIPCHTHSLFMILLSLTLRILSVQVLSAGLAELMFYHGHPATLIKINRAHMRCDCQELSNYLSVRLIKTITGSKV